VSTPWLLLFAAGLLEVVWASMLKQTYGFTRLWPSVVTIAAMIASFWLLASAVKHIPISIAYPVWVGIGAAGAYAVSVLLLGEAFRPLQLLWVGMIIVGAVMLKVGSPGPAPR
jgi:quaternary ammonium compound-resistance protein SugE